MDEKGAVKLLKKHSNSTKDFRGVLLHSRGVQRYALEMARRVNINSRRRKKGPKADLAFIRTAALLHDIGRFKVPPGRNSGAHGYVGGQILKKEGLDRRFMRVCETHIGYWVTRDDVVRMKMPIPRRSYMPKTIEEKIISYADKLVLYTKRIGIKEVLRRYEKELGRRRAQRLMLLHNEMQELMGR